MQSKWLLWCAVATAAALATPRWKGVAWEHIDHCFAEDHAQCKVAAAVLPPNA